MAINRFEVYLVNLDPTAGSEIQKTRPCLVVSPDEINHTIRTVIVALMTTKRQPYPMRVSCRFQGKNGQVVLDQIRAVDRSRLVTKLGRVAGTTATTVLDVPRKSSSHRPHKSCNDRSFLGMVGVPDSTGLSGNELLSQADTGPGR